MTFSNWCDDHTTSPHIFITLPMISCPKSAHSVSSLLVSSSSISMEACFVSANSFTEAISPINGRTRIRIGPARTRSGQCRTGKAAAQFSVSCCQTASDWRAFRARLVAGADPIGDKWIHPIHDPEKGCLLIATEKLDGVHIFERTVILLLSTGPIGPTGLILNRPSLMSIKEMRPATLDVSSSSEIFSDRALYFGGPLEDGLFLVSPKDEESADMVGKSGVFEEVMRGVYYGTKESVGCAAEMVKRGMVGDGDLRFFDGYCAWETEQLKGEIRAGLWALAASGSALVGLTDVGLWEEVIGLMGPRKVW
ncbi:uncharacterized protein LOC127258280 [Andrographis paniculata]|uniref:uncharacterized protein LOC127258280 n=1 Tax=Andrographis paniculata TaxID=175694 RepID=UPI0021E8D1E2|nr:uncharacterized protein LOC127258280 [Andrographis paniculata]